MKAILFAALLAAFPAFAQDPDAAPVLRAEPFTSLAAIGAVVPDSVKLKNGNEWSVVGIERANDAVVAKAQNQPAALHLKVQVFEAYKEDGWSYRLMAPDSEVTINGVKIFCRIWAYFHADQADALARVHQGSELLLTGALGRADVRMYDGQPGLCLDLHDAKVRNTEPFTSLQAIAGAIPAWVELKIGADWSVVGVDRANDACIANAQNQPARLPITVQVFQPYNEDGWAYRIMAPDTEVTINGTAIFCRTWAYFRADQRDALAEVHTGAELVLAGTLGRADVRMYEGRPGLCLDLYEAKVCKGADAETAAR